jgi:hypothetical protein
MGTSIEVAFGLILEPKSIGPQLGIFGAVSGFRRSTVGKDWVALV